MFIPWHSHNSWENIWSCYNIVLCWNWIGFCFFEVRLPLDKIDKCPSLIAIFLSGRKVALKEIHSLTGMLRFACSYPRSSLLAGPSFLGAFGTVQTSWSCILIVHYVLERFLAENGAMGNSLILDYTRTLLCLSFIWLFLVICGVTVVKWKIAAGYFWQIKTHLFVNNKQSCKDKNLMVFFTKFSPGFFTKQYSFWGQTC